MNTVTRFNAGAAVPTWVEEFKCNNPLVYPTFAIEVDVEWREKDHTAHIFPVKAMVAKEAIMRINPHGLDLNGPFSITGAPTFFYTGPKHSWVVRYWRFRIFLERHFNYRAEIPTIIVNDNHEEL